MDLQFLIQVSEPTPTPASDSTGATRGAGAAVSKNLTTDGQGPICIVDDDGSVCDSLTVLLEIHGFAVHAYSSAADFLNSPERDKARCLVVDQHMPRMGGLELIAELKRQRIVLPSILITGRLDAAITQRAHGLGVTAVLEKPFPVARLVELIQATLASRG